MKRNIIHTLWAAALLLTACTQEELADDNRLPEGEYPVVIRATVDGDWQGVTSLALKLGDAVKEYTVTASTDFKSATLSRENDPHYWTSRDPITVSAWWPFDNADITQMPAVKVAEDQSKLADFQNSDFIAAENRKVEFNNPTLEFNHRTARVAIELKPGTGFTSVAGAAVSLVSLSADNGNPTAIKTYNASGNTYEALTAPQTVAAGEQFIRVDLGGGTFYFSPQNDVVLEAGSCYTYTVKVNSTGLTLEDCTIGDWTDGGDENVGVTITYDGTETEPKIGDYYYSDGTWSDGGLRKRYADGTMEWAEPQPQPESGKTVIAIVFHAGHHENDSSDYSATGIGSEKCHGYAVALQDATSSYCMWGDHGIAWGCFPTDGSGDNYSTPDIDWSGYAWTQKIITAAGGKEKLNATEQSGYPATYYAVVDYENNKAQAPANSSGWFLPSIGQMWNVYQNRTSLFDGKTGVSVLKVYWYWSSSESYSSPARFAICVNMYDGNVLGISKSFSNSYVRPVLAF